MSESATVASEGAPVADQAPAPPAPRLEGDDGCADRPGAETTTTALLRGGPAAGKQIRVPRIAKTFPLFIGVDGGNYVRDMGTHDRPVYNWWPKGANHPAGDPTSRTDAR